MKKTVIWSCILAWKFSQTGVNIKLWNADWEKNYKRYVIMNQSEPLPNPYDPDQCHICRSDQQRDGWRSLADPTVSCRSTLVDITSASYILIDQHLKILININILINQNLEMLINQNLKMLTCCSINILRFWLIKILMLINQNIISRCYVN